MATTKKKKPTAVQQTNESKRSTRSTNNNHLVQPLVPPSDDERDDNSDQDSEREVADMLTPTANSPTKKQQQQEQSPPPPPPLKVTTADDTPAATMEAEEEEGEESGDIRAQSTTDPRSERIKSRSKSPLKRITRGGPSSITTPKDRSIETNPPPLRKLVPPTPSNKKKRSRSNDDGAQPINEKENIVEGTVEVEEEREAEPEFVPPPKKKSVKLKTKYGRKGGKNIRKEITEDQSNDDEMEVDKEGREQERNITGGESVVEEKTEMQLDDDEQGNNLNEVVVDEQAQEDSEQEGEGESVPDRRQSAKKKGKGKGKALFNQAEDNTNDDDDDDEEEEEDADIEENGDEDGNETDYSMPPGNSKVRKKTQKKVNQKGQRASTQKGKGKQKQVQNSQNRSEEEDDDQQEEEEEDDNVSKKKNTSSRSNRKKSNGPSPDRSHSAQKGSARQRRKNDSPPPAKEKPRKVTPPEQPHLNRFQPPEEDLPDDPKNPNRLESFTHWDLDEEDFIPDKIWLHSHAPSWWKDDSDNDEIDCYISRDQVVELIRDNGGQVFGPKLEDIKHCNLVVLPDWYSEPYEKIWNKANFFSTAESTIEGKDIVNRSWIFNSIELQTDKLPGYRCDPYDPSYVPPAPKIKSVASKNWVTIVDSDEEEVLRLYKITEEEETYWFKLAKKVETGKRSQRMSKKEMCLKMQNKFWEKYQRNRLHYSELYPVFYDRMLDKKKSREPDPKTKEARKKLREMKLFSDTEEEEGEETYEQMVGEGEEESSTAEEALVQDTTPGKKRNIFAKKKSQAQLAREGGGDGGGSPERDFSQQPQPNEFESSEEDENEEVPANICETLAKEYSRSIEQIQGIWFYSNFSPRRARKVLDLLQQAKELREEDDNDRCKEFLRQARKNLFSADQDGDLIAMWRDEHYEPEDHYRWDELKKNPGWTDQNLKDRIEVLTMEGSPWDPRIEERRDVRESLWYPNYEDL